MLEVRTGTVALWRDHLVVVEQRTGVGHVAVRDLGTGERATALIGELRSRPPNRGNSPWVRPVDTTPIFRVFNCSKRRAALWTAHALLATRHPRRLGNGERSVFATDGAGSSAAAAPRASVGLLRERIAHRGAACCTPETSSPSSARAHLACASAYLSRGSPSRATSRSGSDNSTEKRLPQRPAPRSGRSLRGALLASYRCLSSARR